MKLGKKLFGTLHHFFVNINHHYPFYRFITQRFSQSRPFTASYNKHMFYTRMQNKRGMYKRLMIDKFVRLSGLKLIIKDETSSVIIGIYDDDFLYLCLNLTYNIPKGMFMKFMIIEIIIYPICRSFFHRTSQNLYKYTGD